MPKRLQSASKDEEKTYKYEPYKFEKVEFVPATGTQAVEPLVAEKLNALKERLFNITLLKTKKILFMKTLKKKNLQ